MIRAALALLALVAGPASAQRQGPDPAPDATPASGIVRERVERALVAGGYQGVYAVSLNGTRVAGGAIGAADAAGAPFRYEAIFPWASVTKQVVATMVMQLVDAGRVRLDAPASAYLPALRSATPTVRQLLQHRSGLANPDDTAAGAGGVPAWYTGPETGLPWCLAQPRRPAGGNWRYNNCDYLVLGAIVERVEGRPLAETFVRRVAGASGSGALFLSADGDPRADATWPGGPTAAERATLARFGAAGGLVGTAEDMLLFDRALLNGRLLSDAARAEAWRGDPALGTMALGVWSFAAPLNGCAGPVAIVERRGGIGRFQARNILMPALGAAVVLLTNREDQQFGEVWEGRGLSHAVLSAVACA